MPDSADVCKPAMGLRTAAILRALKRELDRQGPALEHFNNLASVMFLVQIRGTDEPKVTLDVRTSVG